MSVEPSIYDGLLPSRLFVPCVTTSTRITASARCPGAKEGEDKQLRALSLLFCLSLHFFIFLSLQLYSISFSFIHFPVFSLSIPPPDTKPLLAASTPILWPSAGAGRGPGDCGELNFHRLSHIVVTVWLTVKITLCSYHNPSTWI